MKTASISEAKNQLSALLDRVKAGESVLITDRGVPVATLEPVTKMDDPEARIARLERAGIIKRGTGKVPLEVIRRPPPKTRDGSSVLEALLEERRTGR